MRRTRLIINLPKRNVKGHRFCRSRLYVFRNFVAATRPAAALQSSLDQACRGGDVVWLKAIKVKKVGSTLPCNARPVPLRKSTRAGIAGSGP